MAAVASFLSRDGRPSDDVVRRMLAAAPHRGDRLTSAVRGRCCVGVAARSGWDEAWVATDERWAAAFAGTLDNAGDLTAARTGVSPADIVLAAFSAGDDRAIVRFRGTFAVAVTDGVRLWCFRDHIGFRALFVRDDASGCYVASEAKQVLAGAEIPREPDLTVVERILFDRYDDDTPCAVRGVRRIPKATLFVADEVARIRRYWDPASLLETGRYGDAELEEAFHTTFEAAVRRTLTGADALFLSGGIDSPAVAAFAAPAHLDLSGRPLTAVSAVYPGLPTVDERDRIEAVARDLRLPLHTFEPSAPHLERVDEWVGLFDGPTPAWLIGEVDEHLAQVRQLGLRNVLTGELAEYLVSMQRHLLTHLVLNRRFRPVAMRMRQRRAAGSSWGAIARELARPFVPASVERWRSTRSGPRAGRPVPDFVQPNALPEAGERSVPRRRRWEDLQLLAFEGPGLTLEAGEVHQEVACVTVRRPWADVDLWELFLSLPAEVKFPDLRSKPLVRDLLRGRVNDVILDRTANTVFNDAITTRIDYADLRKWLLEPDHLIAGINYGRLRDRLEREDLGLMDYLWAKDLAAAHAFLSTT